MKVKVQSEFNNVRYMLDEQIFVGLQHQNDEKVLKRRKRVAVVELSRAHTYIR